MEAIILAGGFGTRLRHVVSDVPKPMAPMNSQGLPFLQVILDQLKLQRFTHVVMATGYMSEVIEQYFGEVYQGIAIEYSREESPMLTGGAIRMALRYCQEEQVFILNGDTFFSVDMHGLLKNHQAKNADLSIAVCKMYDFDRYGTVQFDETMRIQSFCEKRYYYEGWINGGVYCLTRSLATMFPIAPFSFEKDFMEKRCANARIIAFPTESYFIDIGIPEDYEKARKKFG